MLDFNTSEFAAARCTCLIPTHVNLIFHRSDLHPHPDAQPCIMQLSLARMSVVAAIARRRIGPSIPIDRMESKLLICNIVLLESKLNSQSFPSYQVRSLVLIVLRHA